jgi:hypothetical protein
VRARLGRRHRARAGRGAIVRVAVKLRVGLAARARHRCLGERVGEPCERAGVAARGRPCVGFRLQRVGQPHVRGDVDAARHPDLVAGLECVELRARLGFERRVREAAAPL